MQLVISLSVCTVVASTTWLLFGEQLWVGVTLLIAWVVKFVFTLTLKKVFAFLVIGALMRSIALLFFVLQRVLLPIIAMLCLTDQQQVQIDAKINAARRAYQKRVVRIRHWVKTRPVTFGTALAVNAIIFLFALSFFGEYIVVLFKVMWETIWLSAKFLGEFVLYLVRSVRNAILNAVFRGYVLGHIERYVPDAWNQRYAAWHQKQKERAARQRDRLRKLWKRKISPRRSSSQN